MVGVDLTPEMLERAHDAVPEAVFHQADLSEIPADDGQFALIVCGLALAHADLSSAISELARVLTPAGT